MNSLCRPYMHVMAVQIAKIPNGRCTLIECCICVGISKWTVNRILRKANCDGPDLSSMAKWYKVSRPCVLVDTFDGEAIRRMYQLHEGKENKTLLKLLVTRLCVKTSFQTSLKATMEPGISALCVFNQHGNFLCCCYASHFC